MTDEPTKPIEGAGAEPPPAAMTDAGEKVPHRAKFVFYAPRVKEPVSFLASGEFKRMVAILLLSLGIVAAVIQYRMNQARFAADIQKDHDAWEKRQEALKAPPQPGVMAEGAEVLWDNTLVTEKDDAPLDDIAADRGFQTVIRSLAQMKPGETIKPKGEWDYADLLKNPAHHRGTIVSVSGLVNKIYTNIRLQSNQGAFDSVYRIYLVDLSGTQGAIVDVLDRPDGIRDRMAVESDAVFIRTVKFEVESKSGAVKYVRVPYFVARSVQPVKRPETASAWNLKTTIIVASICLVLVVLIFVTGRPGGPKDRSKPETTAASA